MKYPEGKTGLYVYRMVAIAGKIRCPCKRCRNILFKPIKWIGDHITDNGWDPLYTVWDKHGELAPPTPPPQATPTPPPLMSDMTSLLDDLSYIPLNNEHNEPTQEDIGETSNEPTQATRNEFKELYSSANEALYPGCDHVTRLDFMAKFTYFKVKGEVNKDLQFCPVCNMSRWKDSDTPGKKVPRKPGKMQHPVDGGAWKKFDMKYLDFAKEPRNVRLGLCADGFNPFGNLRLRFYGPKKGVETTDIVSGQNFNMRAMVLWTINDFPARSSLSGWSGQEASYGAPHKWWSFSEFNGDMITENTPKEYLGKLIPGSAC
ncbi:hypothetical protein Tco_0291899 [Tanacetum coccineum]